MADLGVDGLMAVPQELGFEQAAHLDDAALQKFGDSAESRRRLAKASKNSAAFLKRRCPDSQGGDASLPEARVRFPVPSQPQNWAESSPTTWVWAKRLQTLTWLEWTRLQQKEKKPALVICPASVLHNWRREANRFTPQMRVLVLESGAARHNLRNQIPEYDLIVTNYALLRRDLEALQKFSFRAVVLDEAQFIKNPDAQIAFPSNNCIPTSVWL